MDATEQDYHNFSTASSHRLPTVSGTQAIRNARRNAQPIPTSLAQLDQLLGQASNSSLTNAGGVPRGVVTELFGPPGVGKTTFALQVAVNALHTSAADTSVTWIDTSSQLVRSRLNQLIEGYRLPSGHDPASSPPLPQHPKDVLLAERFNHLQITTLARLLALFLYPSPNFPPPNTQVIVLDDLSNLIFASLPRSSRSVSTKNFQRTPASIQDATLAKRALARRFQVLSSFASALQKFAATNNVAILVTSKATVNLKVGQRAGLRPALASQQWDNYLSTRIALYRDFWPDDLKSTTQKSEDLEAGGPSEFEKRGLRFAKIVRLGNRTVSSPEVGFVIKEGGLRGVSINFNYAETNVLPLATQPLHPLEDVLDTGANQVDGLVDESEEMEDEVAAAVAAVAAAAEIPPIEAPGKSKRKAIEIADSDEEDAGVDSDDSVSLPRNASQKSEFRPSSQVLQQGTRPAGGSAVVVADRVKGDEDSQSQEEMLLDTYEKEVPPFSQAAADMSEPLTPSDDDRDIS